MQIILSKQLKKTKKRETHPFPEVFLYFSQKENVSSPVWKENKNEVGKNKKKTQISHNLGEKKPKTNQQTNTGWLVWSNICNSKNNSEVL